MCDTLQSVATSASIMFLLSRTRLSVSSSTIQVSMFCVVANTLWIGTHANTPWFCSTVLTSC